MYFNALTVSFLCQVMKYYVYYDWGKIVVLFQR